MAEALRLVSDPRQPSARVVVSGPGGPLEASPRLRRLMVAFADGRILAVPGAFDDPELRTLRQRADSVGITVSDPEPASLEEISAANANVADAVEYATQARQALQSILDRAARSHASDILISRGESAAEVRFRIRGVMRNFRTLDPERATAISNAALNRCDVGDSIASATRAVRAAITSRRGLPKDVLGVRLQYAPTAAGFVLILRLAYESTAIRCASLEEAGFGGVRAGHIRAALQSAAGVFIVAGPTEHGKSTTLNLAIEEFAHSYCDPPNVVAVEDPPETRHLSFVQCFSVNTSVDSEETAFRNALQAALRLAPDGIKIGELRDSVSAATAYRAAGSGALVFTTLHAPLATDVPFRLMDLGLSRAHAFDRLNLLWIAQRLVPLVCERCAVPAARAGVPAFRALLAEARRHSLPVDNVRFAGVGCRACGGGYAGRLLVSEIVQPDATLLETGLDPGLSRQAFRRLWLQRGGASMTVDAFARVESGAVPLEGFVRNVADFETLRFDLRHGAGPS